MVNQIFKAPHHYIKKKDYAGSNILNIVLDI